MALDDHHKHFMGPIAQKAVIEKDGKILLVQYPSGDPAAGLWDLPGGRLHEGERAIDGLKREVKEEVGADINVGGVLATGVNVGPAFSAFFVIYRATLVDPNQELVPEEGEIGTIEWRDKKDFFTLKVAGPGFQEALKDILV